MTSNPSTRPGNQAPEGMGRAGGIAQVGAGQVVPQLIRKGAFENEDLLAAAVGMPIKPVMSTTRWLRSAFISKGTILLNRRDQGP